MVYPGVRRPREEGCQRTRSQPGLHNEFQISPSYRVKERDLIQKKEKKRKGKRKKKKKKKRKEGKERERAREKGRKGRKRQRKEEREWGGMKGRTERRNNL